MHDEGSLTLQQPSISIRLPRDVMGLSDFLTDFFNPQTERRSRKPPRRLEDRTPTPPRGAIKSHSVSQSDSSVQPRKSDKRAKKCMPKKQMKKVLPPPPVVVLTDEDFRIYARAKEILASEAADDEADDKTGATSVASSSKAARQQPENDDVSVRENPVDADSRRRFRVACRLANENIDQVESLPPPPSPARVTNSNPSANAELNHSLQPKSSKKQRSIRRTNTSSTGNSKSSVDNSARLTTPPPPSSSSNVSMSGNGRRNNKNTDMSPCPAFIQLGDEVIGCQYQSQYPEEYARCKRLFICEFCLTYFKTKNIFDRHVKPKFPDADAENKLHAVCGLRSPPGREIYRSSDSLYSVFEVCGRTVPTYCTQLCLLAKLFLHHKTVFLDVEPFNFYVMTRNSVNAGESSDAVVDDEADGSANFLWHHFVGYFSKERDNPAGWNVSCIVVLPTLQNVGYGRFLIEFSFLLSRRERKPGSPEKPLSEQGERAYSSFYRCKVANYCLRRLVPYVCRTSSDANSAHVEHVNSDATIKTDAVDADVVVENPESKNLIPHAAVDSSSGVAKTDSNLAALNLSATSSSGVSKNNKLFGRNKKRKSTTPRASTNLSTTLSELQAESVMTMQDIGEALTDLGIFKVDWKAASSSTSTSAACGNKQYWFDLSAKSHALQNMVNVIRHEFVAEKHGRRIVLEEQQLFWQPRFIPMFPYSGIPPRHAVAHAPLPAKADNVVVADCGPNAPDVDDDDVPTKGQRNKLKEKSAVKLEPRRRRNMQLKNCDTSSAALTPPSSSSTFNAAIKEVEVAVDENDVENDAGETHSSSSASFTPESGAAEDDDDDVEEEEQSDAEEEEEEEDETDDETVATARKPRTSRRRRHVSSSHTGSVDEDGEEDELSESLHSSAGDDDDDDNEDASSKNSTEFDSNEEDDDAENDAAGDEKEENDDDDGQPELNNRPERIKPRNRIRRPPNRPAAVQSRQQQRRTSLRLSTRKRIKLDDSVSVESTPPVRTLRSNRARVSDASRG